MEGLPVEVDGVRVEVVGSAWLRVTDTRSGDVMEQRVAPSVVDARAWADALPTLLAAMMRRLNLRCLPPEYLIGPTELLTDPRALDVARATDVVRQVADGVGLGAHADALVALRRTGIALHPGAGPSRIGGLPLLPSGTSWPHRDGVPMTLLAQIDLAQAAAVDDDLVLPDGRFLQIFADLDSGLAWDDSSAVHVAVRREDELVPASPPAHVTVLPAREVTMAADALSVPPLASPFYRGLPDMPLLEFLNDLHPPLDDDHPRHRLLGYPDPLQNDPWEHLDGPAAEWRLLAQLDSEPDATLGDNGLIYVFLPADGDLSRARGIFQTH